MTATPAASTQGAITRCRLVGFGPGTGESPLWGLLRGMCTSYDRLPSIHEYGLNIPLESGTKSMSAQLIHNTPVQTAGATEPPKTSYLLRQQNAPKRGRVYNELPADVIEVFETVFYDNHALQFLLQLGAQQVYHVTKAGLKYVCMQQGREVEVMVYTHVTSADAYTTAGRNPMCLPANHLLVEATCLVPDEQQEGDAARALGAFAERLLPLVHLKKLG